MSLSTIYKKIFFIGLICLAISFFFDWYYIQVFYNGALVESWSYNHFLGFYKTIDFGAKNRPAIDNLTLLIVSIVHLIFIFLAGLIVLSNDLESNDNIENLKPYASIIAIVIGLSVFFITIFPIWYLINNKLYFPYLCIKSGSKTYLYFIGIGYVLQIIGFLFTFPYGLHYYCTVEKFRSNAFSRDAIFQKIISKYNKEINIDKDIAELKSKIELNEGDSDLTNE